MKDRIETRIIDVCCPITGHTERMELAFLIVNEKAFDVQHNFCDQYHLCETCRRCGADVKGFFKANPDWRELTPYAPLRLSPQGRE